MFRFQDKQLHFIILLILVTGCIFFFFFCRKPLPSFEGGKAIAAMDDFSDGWLLTGNKKTEVVFFPKTYKVGTGDKLSFYHRVPDMTNESIYLFFQTTNQKVQVKIDEQVIYESSREEAGLNACHVVRLLPEYQNQNVVITYTAEKGKRIIAPRLLTGTKTQLFGELFRENWKSISFGILLILVCICFLIDYALIDNARFMKGVLLYGCLEGIAVSILLFLWGSVVPALTGWNYGVCMLRIMLLIITGILHLMIMGCLVYKRSEQAKIHIGIIVYLVYDICVIVLSFFALIEPKTLETATMVLFWLAFFVYMGILLQNYQHNNKKETKSLLWMNGIISLGAVLQLVMIVIGKDLPFRYMILPVSFGIYEVCLLLYGLKRALHKTPVEDKKTDDREVLRHQVISQMNPNLLFASFHTLQNLIKTGSSQGTKMIYYISMYFKSNLKAIEQPGEIIPFMEELEHILAYLQLQKTRNSKMNYKVECKVKDFQIPRNSIEPLVENAVKHGIAGKEDKGNVVLRTYMRADGYGIQIIDDGIGFDKKLLKGENPTSVLSIISVLEHVCKAKVEIISHEGKGTVITIILPMLENELMSEESEQS